MMNLNIQNNNVNVKNSYQMIETDIIICCLPIDRQQIITSIGLGFKQNG